MKLFIAFIIGLFLGGIFGVLIMAMLIGAKKSRGNYYMPEDD